MAMLETQPTQIHYEPDPRSRTSLIAHNSPADTENNILNYSAGLIDYRRMTRSLISVEPRFHPTPSTLPPIEMWLMSSYRAESSLLDEAEFEVDIADAGLWTRHVTVQIVSRVTAPRSSSLTADEINLLLDDDAWQ